MSEPIISIHPAETWDDYVAAEEIQNRVWETNDATEIVSARLLKEAHTSGGLLLCAYADDRMIGFVFGFVGTGNQKYDYTNIWHCSHMLAVLPKFRGKKIGERLKYKQREHVINQGIELITWTFDPLQAINANLNLSRLGAIVRGYIPDMYGTLTDSINVGLPSDRFQAEWWLNSRWVKQLVMERQEQSNWDAVLESDVHSIFEVSFDRKNFPHIKQENEIIGESILVEISSNFSALKKTNIAFALEWRMRTRDLFQRLFGTGYTVVDFVTTQEKLRNRAAYILTCRAVEPLE